MGRPQKNGLDRFCLPVNFFGQDVVRALCSEFGLKGEITLVKLLCGIYRQGYYLKWNTTVRIRLLGELPGVNAELLTQIVQRLVRWNYFDSSLYHQHKILTNHDVQFQYFSLIRRRKLPKKLPYLLVIVGNNGVSVCNNSIYADNYRLSADNNGVIVGNNFTNENASQENSRIIADINEVSADINGIIVGNNGVSVCNNSISADNNHPTGVLFPSPPITPSTYKEKKIPPKGGIKKKKDGERKALQVKEKSCAKKEKEFVEPTLQQVQEYCSRKGIGVNPKRFLSYYKSVGWVTGNGIPITDWQAKLDEWTINEETRQKNNYGKKKDSSSIARGAVTAGDNGLPSAQGDTRWGGSDI